MVSLMMNVRKAAVQCLLALFVLNTAVCTCAATVSENAVDAHAHHQHNEASSRPDCHDGACLGSCSQTVAAKPGSVAAFAQGNHLELEQVVVEPVELIVAEVRAVTKDTGPPFHQYPIQTDTPVTRKDRLLA